VLTFTTLRINFGKKGEVMPELEPKKGIQETTEVIIALNELSIAILEVLLDGLQIIDDVRTLYEKVWGDPRVKQILTSAIEGIKAVPGEISDVDLSEGVQLAILQAGYLPKIIEAIKNRPQTS